MGERSSSSPPRKRTRASKRSQTAAKEAALHARVSQAYARTDSLAEPSFSSSSSLGSTLPTPRLPDAVTIRAGLRWHALRRTERECLIQMTETNMAGIYGESAWPGARREKLKDMAHADSRFVLLVEPNGEDENVEIVAFFQYRFLVEDDTFPCLYLYELQTASKQQKRGLGSCMLERARRTAELGGVGWVFLTVLKTNRIAMDMYAKRGFVPAPIDPGVMGYSDANYVIMRCASASLE